VKTSVLVIGLGRFGSAAARELERLGHEVLAVDRDETAVNDIAPEVTQAIQLDAVDEGALRSVGAAEFQVAIVAISSAIEASIFATMALKQLGVAQVIAKAATPLHGAILERVGADRVVFAEREMGQRVAHSFAIPGVLDYLDIAPRFGIVRIRPPEAWTGRALKDLDLPIKVGVSPIAIRRGKEVTLNPHRDMTIQPGDELILMGADEKLERIARA
jgi:trk system potassium uptake protein TrkA